MHTALQMFHAAPARSVLLALSLGLFFAGCATPLDRSPEEALRERIIAARREHLAQQPGKDGPITVSREPSEVEQQLSAERTEQLDDMSGISSYEGDPLELGTDLMGQTFGESETVELTLERAVKLAVEHNLDLGVARLLPDIAFEDVMRAEAAFDAVFFADVDYAALDTPQSPGAIQGLSSDTQSQDVTLNTGIRKRFDYGTSVTLETTPRYQQRRPTFNLFDNYYTASVAATVQQPLLEGFGPKANRAEVRLARNATLAQRQELRVALLQTVAEVHEAYWNLYNARSNLFIQQRLLTRTTEDRDRLVERRDFDVSPVRITEANSFVELRRSDVIRARQQVRVASDRLKRLMSAPELPVAGETLLLPAEEPTREPVTFNLIGLVSESLQQRPEMEQALLDISDARVRLDLAENAELPRLDLAFTVRLNALNEDDLGRAYEDDIAELNFIDYVLALRFEQALGNREDRALRRRRQLEREQAGTAYRRQAETVVLEVKTALRDIITSYELIGASRAARRAAADSLRAIEAQEEAGVALTPEFLLDLKLATQQRLADAEAQEVSAVADYNTAIADLFAATGTLLERNGIDVEAAPDWPGDAWWNNATDSR
jgi:outer membrane protein